MRDTELLLKISKVPNDTNGELTKVNKRIDDIGVSTNGPIVGSKKNTVEVTSSTNRVAIGIPEFVKTRDVLLVYVNSVFVEEGSDYRISANGDYIEKIEGNWAVNGPKTFNFVALMNLPGLSDGDNAGVMYGVKVGHKHTRTYVAGPTREVAIAIPEFSRHKDVIEVHVNGVYLAEGNDYTVSNDSAKIIKVAGEWSDCVVNIDVLLNSLVVEQDTLLHGSLIVDETVTETKLSPEVTAKLNARKSVPYLASGNNIAVDDWVGPNADGMYTANVEHGLSSDKILVAAIDVTSKRSVMVSFKVIDGNNIQVEIDAKRAITLSILSVEEADVTQLPNYSESINTIHINKSEWVADGAMKKRVIKHNLRTKNILVSAHDRVTGMSLTLSYKVVDMSSIEIRSDEAHDCDVMIAYKATDVVNPLFQINDTMSSTETAYSSSKVDMLVSGLGGGSNASDINIADKSNMFTATNVEDALLEVVIKVNVLDNQRVVGIDIANTLHKVLV